MENVIEFKGGDRLAMLFKNLWSAIDEWAMAETDEEIEESAATVDRAAINIYNAGFEDA